MRRCFIALFLSVLMAAPLLLTTPADAFTKGWSVYSSNGAKTTWYYVFDDGTMAQGWQYINGNWYYFWPQDEGGITLVGNAYVTKYGTWTHLWDSSYIIDGNKYYFDYEGKLICNANVYDDGRYFYIDADGHPQY